MYGDCKVVFDSYLFDFTEVVKKISSVPARRHVIYLEAPQGFVRLLRRLSDFLEECLQDKGYTVSVSIKLEPSFGACSLSIEDLDYLGKSALLVHIGHEPYVYPICIRGSCRNRLPERIVFVVGEYMEGDAESLATRVEKIVRHGDVAIGYSAQHRSFVERFSKILRHRGYRIVAVKPVLGCYYHHLVKYREMVDAFIVVAGGYFHALGLGLALGGEGVVVRADPYTNNVEDIVDRVRRILAKRFWLLASLSNVRRLGLIVGLLPGQYRPWIVEYLERLAARKGIKTYRLYSRLLNREFLDNLSPSDFDAFVATSCPRLAIEDLGDYWKPVLTPAEARLWLTGGLGVYGYTFPW